MSLGWEAYAADGLLRDGRSIHVRAIRPDDKERLRGHFRRLSAESVHFRFFGAKKTLTEAELRYFTELDFARHVGLVAVRGSGPARRVPRRRPLRPLRRGRRGRRTAPSSRWRSRTRSRGAAWAPCCSSTWRGSPAQRHRRLRGRRAGGQPPHVRAARRHRLRGERDCARHRDPRLLSHCRDRRLGRGQRRTELEGRRRERARHPGAAVGGGRRRLAAPGKHRGRPGRQPEAVRLSRADLSRQPGGGRRSTA